ncbi:MAG: hypothetical protein FJ029_07165 [Actinobacteria bacterium]|nr:hypothetical protein [Actinomycetota bacterium]
MGRDLTPPLQRALWIALLAAALFAFFVVFERVVSRLGFDFIYYIVPSEATAAERLPLSGDDRARLAIREARSFDEVRDTSPTVLVFHADAGAEASRAYLRDEYLRGTILIGVNMTPEQLAQLIEPSIATAAPPTAPLARPFYTLVTKNEGDCDDALRPGCGIYTVKAELFTGFAALTDSARAALSERLKELITPTPATARSTG